MHGVDEKIVPIDATGRQAARMVPDARLVEVSGAAHGMLAMHRREVVDAIAGFLGDGMLARHDTVAAT